MMKIFLIPVTLVTASLLSNTNAATVPAEPNLCKLPPPPASGRYSVIDLGKSEETNAYLALNYTCNDGYENPKESARLCFNGTWSEEPKCVRLCELIENPSVEYSCLNGIGSRPCKSSELEGTLVQPKCRTPNYYPYGMLPHMRCANGSWDYNPSCLPEDTCIDTNGNEGLCVGIQDCASAHDIIKRRVNSTICGFRSKDPIICCPKKDTRIQTKKTCSPVTPRRPDMKIGKIAFHKCVEYQEQLKFPCQSYTYLPLGRDGAPEVSYSRREACKDPPPLIVGSEGVDASRGQFPHMALLGYGKELSTAEWLCGGTIISERFILTAGHCTEHNILGSVSFVRLGILKRSDEGKVVRDYTIKRYIKHPEYKPPSKYNDIALLETAKRIVFLNKHIVPACLDVGDDEAESEAEEASATGWGALGEGAGAADVLQIMDITKFTSAECSAAYGPHRLLKAGFDNATQMCYGHRQIPRDTCKGDSGGPLQVEYSGVRCMHKVIGVTSFGKACGHTGQPGVYTRVKAHVAWLEAIVWPGRDVYVFAT